MPDATPKGAATAGLEGDAERDYPSRFLNKQPKQKPESYPLDGLLKRLQDAPSTARY